MVEREQLKTVTAAEIKKGLWLYLIPFLALSGAAIYINLNWIAWKLDAETLRSVINTVLVVGALLMGRLFVNKVLQHNKAANGWKKKVIRGKIHGKNKNTLYISNQKVTLPAAYADQFNVEDEVEIGLSQVNDIVIYAMKK